MGQRVDFSANAPIYDRRHGATLSVDVARSLCSAGALGRGARVLDVGAGTGRVSIALADLGSDVVAVDASVPMLSALRSKSANTSIPIVAAEGAHLPFQPESFDAVIFARILYVMADWKACLREAFHTLKAGGLLFHEWGNGSAGEAWVQIREKARSLFEDAGVGNPFHPGAREEADVDSYLLAHGFVRKGILETGPGPSTTLRDFLARIESGELSYIWPVPAPTSKTRAPRPNAPAEHSDRATSTDSVAP